MPVVPAKGQLLFRRGVVIYARRGEVGKVVILRVPRIRVAVGVGVRDPGRKIRNLVIYVEDRLSDRVARRWQAFRLLWRRAHAVGGQIQHVDSSKLISCAVHDVGEDALLSLRSQYRNGAGSPHW